MLSSVTHVAHFDVEVWYFRGGRTSSRGLPFSGMLSAGIKKGQK